MANGFMLFSPNRTCLRPKVKWSGVPGSLVFGVPGDIFGSGSERVRGKCMLSSESELVSW